MASSSRKRVVNRLPAERRISDIMRAARTVFAEKGYHDALISDIAERAGMVEGNIYRFFTNKRDLLVRVVEDWFEEIIVNDDEQFAGIRGVWNRIRFVVHQHLVTIRREPSLSRLFFQELRSDPAYRQTRLFELNQIYTHRMIDIVREAAASGEFRTDQTADSVTEIVYNGLVTRHDATREFDVALTRLENIANRLETKIHLKDAINK